MAIARNFWQTEAMTAAIDKIRSLIESHPVMLFMKGSKSFPQCGFSSAVVEVLKKEGAAFETFNVLSDPDVRQALKEFSSWPTFPQLYVGGKFVGGCDIVTEMHKTGELATTLAAVRPT
jgi:monothiol glutaredoxin